jgi:hypothetical protein
VRDAFGVERISKGIPAGARLAAKGKTTDGMLYAVPRVNAHKMGRSAAKIHRQALDKDREAVREYTRAGRWGKTKKYMKLKLKESVRVQLGSISRRESLDHVVRRTPPATVFGRKVTV